MESPEKVNKIKNIRPETLEFIILYNQLKGKAFTGNAQLAEVLGFNSASSITEIIKSRQNIDPEKFRIFKTHYKDFIDGVAHVPTTQVSKVAEGIPMYEITATASGVEVYNDINDAQPVGRMNFPVLKIVTLLCRFGGILCIHIWRTAAGWRLRLSTTKKYYPARFIILNGAITACTSAYC